MSLLRELALIFQNRGWRDLVDVVVVSVLAYRLLLLIRGTRAVQLIAGLGVLALLGVAANYLNLTLTKAIFNNLAPALLIAVVILFQPELRRALDRVGRVGLLGRPLAHYSLQMMGRLVDEVVEGVERLSRSRTGALIVFERDVGLENYALTGVRVNGEVTAELLETIFFPNSPLHDGASLIRGNQLVAAGCILPMAGDEVEVRGRMGTRHRAALGLSLESDAIIVIVSEESGRISLAREGHLQRGIDAETLREILRGALVPRQPSARRLLRRGSAKPTPAPATDGTSQLPGVSAMAEAPGEVPVARTEAPTRAVSPGDSL